ncbi:phosphoenolpyruvate carboxylase [Artemisia annua]|uniref:Phosphoenolpyruvate carboxylase n=1 Tax=Artemisia annua TaxID=35608 RepID=A0A2U1PTG3_ARTAN|nr:phosphoenolpyruvate carboxylase [Artemisia annua]
MATALILMCLLLNFYNATIINWINGKQEVRIGYSDSGNDAGWCTAAWQLYKNLQRFAVATLQYGMNPPISPKPEWRTLMDELAVNATNEYRSIVFRILNFLNTSVSSHPS